VTDAKGHTIEGGYVFTVIGEGFDGGEFRFNEIELVPTSASTQPGETVQAADQHRPRRQHGAAVRAAGQRRLPAAAGDAHGGQEHGERSAW
jgi:hypothetical protein